MRTSNNKQKEETMKTEYAGIDYGHGQTNCDKATGIRYGVIPQHDVLQAWADSSEPFYGEPHCPKCGNEAVDCDTLKSGDELEEWERAKGECEEHACVNCEYVFGNESAYGDEPISHVIDDGEYKAECGEDGDIFVVKSPYYTRAQFCSPCAPGAAYLRNDCDDGVKAYCFGHDWFDGGKAPYPVHSVETDELIQSAS